MTIAITPFDGLCGFRPLKEISHFFSTVLSLRRLIGESAAKEFETSVGGKETSDSEKDVASNKKALQTAFSTLMKIDKETIASAAKDLVASAEKEGESFAGGGGPSNNGKELADLVIRCNSQFEGDIGLFVLFFLNYVKLEIGEAMFLKADDIHAYLSGGTKRLPSHLSVGNLANSCPRRHRMYGLFQQCGPRRFHAQVSGHSHSHHYADLLLRTHLGAENEPSRLPLRYSQQYRLLFILLCPSVRPTYRRIQRRADRAQEERCQGYFRGRPRSKYLHLHEW